MTTPTEIRMFDVYLHKRGKRPVRVGELPEPKIGACTFEHDGVTYYFGTADLTQRTVTFVDLRPEPASVKVPA